MADNSPDSKMLCYCRNVDYGAVRKSIRETNARRVEQVMADCDAGTGCRSCHPEIEALIREAKAVKAGGSVFSALKKLFRS